METIGQNKNSNHGPVTEQITEAASNIEPRQDINHDYFCGPVSAQELEEALMRDNSVLDRRDEYGNDTLLHYIVKQYDQDLTEIVKPYLTQERVAAKNKYGETVLDLLITYVDYHQRHRTYGKLLDVYRGYINEESLTSLAKKKNPDNEAELLIEAAIRSVELHVRGLEDYERTRSSGPSIVVNAAAYLMDTRLLLISLLRIRMSILALEIIEAETEKRNIFRDRS